MNITDVKVRKIFTEGKVKAIDDNERLFVAMPNRLSENGHFQDIVHPICQSGRTQLEAAVLNAYYAEVADTAGTENKEVG